MLVWKYIMKKIWVVICILFIFGVMVGIEDFGNEFSYEYFVYSDKLIKCLYGYVVEKVGDYDVVIVIFKDCIV